MLAGLLCAVSALGAVAPQAVAAAPAVAVTRAASGSDGVQTAPASTALAPSAVAPRASGEVPRLVEAEALRIGQAAVGRRHVDPIPGQLHVHRRAGDRVMGDRPYPPRVGNVEHPDPGRARGDHGGGAADRDVVDLALRQGQRGESPPRLPIDQRYRLDVGIFGR
jgi:hypothetical protein